MFCKKNLVFFQQISFIIFLCFCLSFTPANSKQGNKVIFHKLHTCTTKIKKNKTKGKNNKNKQITPHPPKKQKKPNKQTNICILKLVHKSDLTIRALRQCGYTIFSLDYICSIHNAVNIHSVYGGPVCLALNIQLVFMWHLPGLDSLI